MEMKQVVRHGTHRIGPSAIPCNDVERLAVVPSSKCIIAVLPALFCTPVFLFVAREQKQANI